MATIDKIPLPDQIPNDVTELEYILQKDGALQEVWDKFEHRKAQQQMFLQVARAFRTDDIAIIEAGTGTGKTLAYILPALISRKKTLISTGLKNLQEQLANKDLKFIEDYFDISFSFTILKGRENYLCRRILSNLESQLNKRKRETSFTSRLSALKTWADNITKTGELNELDATFERTPPFQKLSVNSKECFGQNCKFYKNCFLTIIRAAAQNSDLILVNHHLFLANLALTSKKSSFLPDVQAMVFDEAHLLEEIASTYFSKNVSTKELLEISNHFDSSFAEFLQFKEKTLSQGDLKTLSNFRETAEQVKDITLRIQNDFQDIEIEQSLTDLTIKGWKQRIAVMTQLFELLQKALLQCENGARHLISLDTQQNYDFTAIAATFVDISDNLGFIIERDDPLYVYQVKNDKQNADVTFSAIPLEISNYLKDNLFNQKKTIVLTSATLDVKSNPNYFQKKIGIDHNIQYLVLPSPYDYRKTTRLYIPKHLPVPNKNVKHDETYKEEDDFKLQLPPEIIFLLKITKGRALVLFTSIELMNYTHSVLLKENLPYKILKQGEKSREVLLQQFTDDIHSVLLGTKSFFQGIDVPGVSLSAVIVDKIPFPRKDTPFAIAKQNLIISRNGDYFNDYCIPEASIVLKQALGRLIRCQSDKGLLAVLDSRLSTKNYREKITNNLQGSQKIYNHALVKEFCQQF
ncbi:MAG: ATP-dependent DNA helicase [Deltaproteobacteria bacterium]|nr:ATP-dependent DNA helicase [Deltaproteobacteria bacterium]